jgi:hypothetical protein
MGVKGDFNTAFETARHDPARYASSSNSTAATAELPSCFDRVGELLLDVGVLRVIAVSLSGSGPFTSRRIVNGLYDNLRALAEHIWSVTYSAVFETLVPV